MNAKAAKDCSNYSVIRHFLRDGKSPQLLKNRPYFMVDSTYTVASDPNTMRDAGPLRNAIYISQDHLPVHGDLTPEKILQETERVRNMQRERCQHRPGSAVATTQQRTPYKIKKHVLVATNDYTKNISSLIFSPSLKDRPVTI